jgi:hypothetical protein
MSSIDLSHLSGPDALVALRSFPRRFRSAAIPIEGDPDVEEWAQRIGPDGRSVVDILWHTTSSWVLFGQALHQVLTTDDPVVHPAVADADARAWETPAGTTVEDALTHLSDAVTELAAKVAAIHSPDWNRTGRVAGGGSTSALDLVRETVRVGSEGLHEVQTTIDAVRP